MYLIDGPVVMVTERSGILDSAHRRAFPYSFEQGFE
jgi:hypothetical protein